ncbi:MAG: UTP--glucose-1-phosphate uridylyltransferase [Candidatus Margulisbacteria bacterium]|jgi:UDP-N-acetylglucosamine pyrophosphorylase|nr:UTP--glucose-1-phosphate uridylyltransferase [Candidatus Margulisiibacteriota bacterium]
MLKSKNISTLLGDYNSMGSENTGRLRKFAEIMQADRRHPLVIQDGLTKYAAMLNGDTGYIAEDRVSPVASLPSYADLPLVADEAEAARLSSLVEVVNLNGGLGTSMGLKNKAKTLLPVKEDTEGKPLSYLDVIARQIRHNPAASHAFMNSDHTEADTLAYLRQNHADIQVESFLQNRYPKIDRETRAPVNPAEYKGDDASNPPGTGEIYTVLALNGLLDKWLAAGRKYIFISNGDNLAGILDPRIVKYLAANDLPLLMEAAERTPNDMKGGHLVWTEAEPGARRLTLRESGQVDPADVWYVEQKDGKELKHTYGEDIQKHKYFNTNNIWINVQVLKDLLKKYDNLLPLSLILNKKEITDIAGNKVPVYQLESALGSVISLIAGAAALVVPKDRFAPTKKNSDLLLISSNVYDPIGPDGVLHLHESLRSGQLPEIKLDEKYFTKYQDYKERVEFAPGLLACAKLTVNGDVYFGQGVVLVGEVLIDNTVILKNGVLVPNDKALPVTLRNITITGQPGYKYVQDEKGNIVQVKI